MAVARHAEHGIPMPGEALESVLHYLRHVAETYETYEARDVTDADLLRRFRAQRDEAAFTILVQRHGPMVMGVCRRLLGEHHGAEDAFQATFLVLCRNAASIYASGSLAAWLHGVAQRVARKARGRAIRRREQERRSAVDGRAEAVDERTWDDLRLVLDEELGRLPQKYQAPVVLCYFEGKTNEQAAGELGCPKSSLSWRLGRARELLRERLVRRGITLPAGTLAAVLLGQSATASSPALLLIATVKAARRFAAGDAGTVSAEVETLTKGALKTMFSMRLKIATAAVLVAGLLGGSVPVAQRLLAEENPSGAPSRAPAPARVSPFFAFAGNAQGEPAADDQEALQGAWECESAELEGKALPEDEVKKMRVVIKDDRMVIVPGGEFERLAFRVDAAKNPRVLHVTPTEGKDKGKTTPVIYALDQKTDTLKLCFDTKEGKKLPTEFAAKPGSGMILLTFKHELRPPVVAPQAKPDPLRR
jgi:RNA polymerase sigma factor (sigma-70 family)